MLARLSRLLASRNAGVAGAGASPFPRQRFGATSGGNKDGKDQDSEGVRGVEDEDDEFSIEGFEMQEGEEDDLESALNLLSTEGKEVTPELATDLVARMVEATTKRMGRSRHRENIIPYISAHTISTMRATRITTNDIQAAGSDFLSHAIEKKVTAEVNVELLGLSRTAREALEILSGSRWKGSYIKISCNHYPSAQENRAYIVSQIDRLVLAAKTSVGEEVESKPLATWEQVIGEVKRQATEEIEEAGDVSLVLGEAKV